MTVQLIYCATMNNCLLTFFRIIHSLGTTWPDDSSSLWRLTSPSWTLYLFCTGQFQSFPSWFLCFESCFHLWVWCTLLWCTGTWDEEKKMLNAAQPFCFVWSNIILARQKSRQAEANDTHMQWWGKYQALLVELNYLQWEENKEGWVIVILK